MDEGWHHFEESAAHHDADVGRRDLAMAVLPDAVTLAIGSPGRSAAVTISFEEWDHLVRMVDLERSHQ